MEKSLQSLKMCNPKTKGHEISDLNVTLPHPSVDWTPETGYPPGTPVHFLPWRPWGAGTHLGLTIVMDSELDEYYCSSEASTGFKIVLHNPVETPKIATFGTFISPGEQTQYVIQPIINIATQSIEGVAEDKRQCVFSNERRLRFYRTYTQHNCILECEANFTLSFCECVMYYMPKDRFSRICGKRDLECANRAKLAMEMRLSDSLTNITKIVNGTNRPKCGCLPGCYGLSYTKTQSASLLSGKLKIKPELLGNKDPQYFERNIAVLHLFFQDTQFTGFMKGELFGFTEFLSNTGGLLGLFMGFSFLSAFEAFYFLSLRLWCTVIRKRKIESELLETEQADKKFKHMFPFPFLR
ncbi:unnamed protein product [Bemisia tabaci]|uniref:Uncharacterized protein n=1 Tax=Bemisia tabaci TaxID=7038 RepID=A0A9P0CAH7_BEMTA|nr:unnamed protein product [Bemisia tabaci]